MQIYLIRHGESEWNKKGIYQGQKDPDLTALGLEQARLLGGQFKNQSIDQVYASPLKRALLTAKEVALHTQTNLEIDKRLIEICHGDWEGKTRAEIEKEYRRSLNQWRKTPHQTQMPNGEHFEEVRNRVGLFVDEIIFNSQSEKIVIITHDVVLRMICLELLNLPVDSFWQFNFINCALNVLEGKKDHFVLSVINETEHLKGLIAQLDRQAL